MPGKPSTWITQGDAPNVFAKVQRLCDEKALPYPPELVQYLTITREFYASQGGS